MKLLDTPFKATFAHGSAILVAVASKNGATVRVHIYSGFSRRTDGSIRVGSSVYPIEEGNFKLTDFYAVCGTCIGRSLYDYIAEGVAFTAEDGGEAILDDTTTAIEFALEDKAK